MDLTIRPWTEDDEPAMSAAIAASLDELRPWVPFAAHEPLTPSERLRSIRQFRWERAGGGDLHYGMFLDGEVAGGCGLHRRIGPGGIEVGYWVTTSFTGRGVATAAVEFLVGVAFAMPSIDHLEIHHDVRNPASGRVAEKVGFTPAGTVEVAGRVDRIWRLARPT